MKFERIKIKKRVVVESEESEKEFAMRVFKTLADELKDGGLYKCSNFTSSCNCGKCPMHLKEEILYINEMKTNCALIAFKDIANFIASKC